MSVKPVSEGERVLVYKRTYLRPDEFHDDRYQPCLLYTSDLYATSVDYNPRSAESVAFFKMVQNKLHYACLLYTSIFRQTGRYRQ